MCKIYKIINLIYIFFFCDYFVASTNFMTLFNASFA